MTTVERLVVDASVAVKWVLPEANSDRALTLLAAAGRDEVRLFAPDVYLPEVTNALWKRAHVSRDITRDRARSGLDRLLTSMPDLTPSTVLVTQALELALAFEHPVQDCLYVALAMSRDCSLITADQRLIRKFEGAVGRVIDIADFGTAAPGWQR